VAQGNIADSPRWLAEEWARQLTAVFETMTGEAPYVTFTPLETAAESAEPAPSDLLWWEQPFSLGSQFVLWTGAAESNWQEIGRHILSCAGVDDADADNIRSTYLETVRQALSGIAAVLSGRAGMEVSCAGGRESTPPNEPSGPRYSFEVHLGDQARPIIVMFSPSLAVLPEKAASLAAAPPSAEPPKPQMPLPAKMNSIDLLLDVELPVSLSFGRAQLPLKEVIKLTTGSIVELNRAISEPVDVIVNNCVIARGEVVVVEGNFGIRIRQVISRQERLRTLY
jgi:flagellar motor switch protein FliN